MTNPKEHQGNVYSGILLVSGTCMGAGMLAIPLVTGIAGFIPAMAINIVCYLFMMATGLLFLEATLWMPDGANVISMAGRFLGPIGKVLGGAFFLFLYYALMVSYIAGGAPLFTDGLQTFFDTDISLQVGYGIYTGMFAFIVLVGAWFVDRINWILMLGLGLSYFLLISLGARDVNPQNLLHKNWAYTVGAAPILFSAYGYHNVIPSLSTYLRRNRFQLRMAIIVGTTIPFIAYTIWQWLVMGSVPLEMLQEGATSGVPASSLLSETSGIEWVGKLALFFGFFAIVTSLLGVSLSMVDFLGDGFRISRRGWNRALLTLAVFLPPLLFAFKKPDIFIESLGVAGGIGEAFLNGLLPIAMVWIGRYQLKLEGRNLLFGGRTLLTLLFLFTLVIMGIECVHLLS